jgi:hypothetical protein
MHRLIQRQLATEAASWGIEPEALCNTRGTLTSTVFPLTALTVPAVKWALPSALKNTFEPGLI